MNWGRAKTILIVLFLITDFFLLIVLMQTKASVSQISEETISQTAKIMAAHGIQLKPEQIPAKRVKNQNIMMQNFFAQPEQGAEKILGNDAYLTDSDPEEYQYVYESSRGTLQIGKDGFSFLSKKTKKPFAADGPSAKEEISDLVSDRLSDMGIPKKSAEILNVEEKDGYYTCTAIPVYKNTKIYGVSMYITADTEDILSISGNWFCGTKTETYEEALLDVTAVLAEMIYREDKKPMTISEIQSGYYVSDDYLYSREISAVPIYIITDENGENYLFDARVGTVIE